MIITKLDPSVYEVLHNDGNIYHVKRVSYTKWVAVDTNNRAVSSGKNKKQAIDSLTKLPTPSQMHTRP